MPRLKKGSKILIANDSVGVTGVSTYIRKISKHLRSQGYEVVTIDPTDEHFLKVNPSIYKDFNWTLFPLPSVVNKFISERPDAVLIATIEAPIGSAVKSTCEYLENFGYCKECPYTSSYTSYVGIFFKKMIHKSLENIPKVQVLSQSEKILDGAVDFSEEQFLKMKYSGSKRIMVNARSARKKLKDLGLKNIVVSSRGIDNDQFRLPKENDENPYLRYSWYKRKKLPVLIYVGRLAYEKDIHLFLEGDLPNYHRVLIGDGPAMPYLKSLARGKENIHFLGKFDYDRIPPYFMYARLSFFPSSSDTFGQTIVESAASGTPVVAFDVHGPKDVIKKGTMGILVPNGKDLFHGLDAALKIDREKCSEYTHGSFSWEKATKELLKNLYKIKWKKTLA